MIKKLTFLNSRINISILLLLAFFALWAGAMVYIHLRASNPLFIRWIEATGTEKLFSLNHRFFVKLPGWLVYTLPSGLWAFAYAIIITGIWWKNQSWLRYFWFGTVILLVVGWEILQLTGLVFGTFSFGDILAGLLGAVIGILIGIKLTKPYNYEKKIK